MNELVLEGVVEQIGVSNPLLKQLTNAMVHSSAPLLTNQVEHILSEHRYDLLSFCIDEEVMLIAYSPLKIGNRLEDEVVQGIASTHEKTPRQVAIRWLLQQPFVSPNSHSPRTVVPGYR